MNVANFAADLGLGRRWFKAPDGFADWPHACQCLWNFLIWNSRLDENGKPCCRAKDWEMANACGYTLGWVQKALRQLVGLLNPDGDPDPAIERERVYGHQGIAGRLIRIILPLAGPKAKAEPSSSPASSAAAVPSPAVAPPVDLRTSAPEPEPTPEEMEAAAAAWAEIRRKATRPVPAKLSPEEQAAELERRRKAAAARFGSDHDEPTPQRE